MQRMTTLVSLHLLKNNHAMLLKDCLLFFLLREIEGTVFCPYKTNDSMKLADVEIIVHVQVLGSLPPSIYLSPPFTLDLSSDEILLTILSQ